MRSGDPCPACSTGTLLTYKNRRLPSGRAVRYLSCNAGKGCGYTGKEYTQPRPQKRVPELVHTPVAPPERSDTIKSEEESKHVFQS